jgi:flagellin
VTGDANYIQASDTPPSAATLASGADASGGLTQAAVFELSGRNGSEVFSFGANTSISKVADAINLVKDATGVEATVNGTTLELNSTGYGAAAFVELKVISEATGGTISAAIGQSARDEGTDIVATVNGILAKGNGNSISVNTSTLDLATTVAAGFTGSIAFDITGGGALFQLGPDVVSNQQARIGITSVNTARLGGADGVLYQLASGGTADLESDPTKAALIIDEAITQITSLRGRLGAFQRTSLETNKNTLNDTLVNLTEAESQIRDADFAAESAALTRAQILVQSGTTVLQVANSNPQNVLALLR